MRWLDIARKDFQYARRSKVFIAVVAVFVVLTLVIVALPGIIAIAVDESLDSEILGEVLFPATATAGGLIIPVTAMVAGYLSIVGERESGRLRLLLSLPPTRKDVVLGKLAARTALVTLAIVLAYALAVVAGAIIYQTLPLASVLWTILLTTLLAVSFTGIAVGISATVDSRMKAIALVLVLYVVTVVLWQLLLTAVAGLNAFVLDANVDSLLAFLDTFPPTGAFSELYDSLAPDGALSGGASNTTDRFFQDSPFLFVLMVAWTVVPVAVGYFLFERADLG